MDTSRSRSRQLWIKAASLLAVLALALPTASVSFASSASPFVGRWVGTDFIDGSTDRLVIGGPPEGPFQITLTESYVRRCNGGPAIVRGTGWLRDGDPFVLEANVQGECLSSGEAWESAPAWRYHADSDTLGSLAGGDAVITIWTRPGEAGTEPPPLYLRVNYGEDWVESWYEAGHSAWITVMSADLGVKGSTETVTEPKSYWDGGTGLHTGDSVWFDDSGNEMDEPPDFQPDDWVFGWLDNGASARVRIGVITGEINLEADTISGTVAAPWITEPVDIECVDWGSGLQPPLESLYGGSILADGTSSYLCSWSGLWDILPGQVAGVGYSEPDGQWVANTFVIPNPTFVAYIPFAIEGYDWPMGSWIDVEIYKNDVLVYSGSSQSEQRDGAPPGETRVLFDVGAGGYAMQAGDHVIMTDGAMTKDTVVTNLAVTSIDVAAKTVSGTYDPALSLWVWLYDMEGQVPAVSPEAGTWIASFAELPLGAWGGATQWEPDGDGTSTDFQVPAPYLTAFPADEEILGYGWPTGSEVHLSINDPPALEQTVLVGPAPWSPDDIRAAFTFGAVYDLVPGDVVTLSGSGMEITYVVHDVSIGNVDEVTNTVSGTSESGAEIYAWIHGIEGSELQTPVEAGAWLADFGAAGFDLLAGMCGRAEIRDGFGNSTADDWCIEEPPPGDLWIAAYISDPMTWSPGSHNYYFESSFTFPASGGEITPPMEFTVSEAAPMYAGTVLFRPWALREFGDGSCPAIADPQIRPDQPTRFLYGWITDYPMTYAEAAAHFDSLTVTAYPDGGAGIPLMRQELLQYDPIDWGPYVCSFAQ